MLLPLELFNNLNSLSDTSEAFFYVDQSLNGTTYRIFNYRLASYTEFCKPSALECRGIMFELDNLNNFVRLACRPMEKFFNLGENPFTENLSYASTEVKQIMMKADGSLISTFIHTDGELYCKSKGSLSSDQAKWANAWIRADESRYEEFKQVTAAGYTINFEYCAPYNRIVLNYGTETVIVLNVRCNETGEYLSCNQIEEAGFTTVTQYWVQDARNLPEYENYATTEQLIDDCTNLTDIEGFVVQLNSGQHFKVKTEWYLTQHRAKDDIDSPRRLFTSVLMEVTDDLKSLFHDNPAVIQNIVDMETKAGAIYNHVVDSVERFVSTHINLIDNNDRKTYAITAQKHFTGPDAKFFSLAMQVYLQRTEGKSAPNYKEFCIKHWKDWGIADVGPTVD